MTTTGSLGGGRKEPMSAVDDAVEALRQAMLDEGQDPGSVEAKLHAAIPNTEGDLVGNFADLQRMGAIATTGTLPTPPGDEDVETSDLSDAFVEPSPPGDGDGGGTATAADTTAEGEVAFEDMTKAELQAELDSRGVEYSASATKQELVDLANEG
jgi:hypothetical protein